MGNRGKEILLLVLAVVALGFAIYTFRPKESPQPAPEQVAVASEGDRDTTATAPGTDDSQSGAAGTGMGPAAGGARNPFATPEAGGAAAAPPLELSGAFAGPGGVLSEETPAPTLDLPPVEGEEGTDTSDLRLTGIVAGPKPLALVRHGDQRYFLKVGDRVQDRYRVKAIRSHEVELVSETDTIILRMGGRQ